MVRILGSTGTRRRRRYQLAAIFSVTVLLAAFAALPAQAVHDVGVFELDKNATTTSTEDWDLICKAHLTTSNPPESDKCLKAPTYTLPSGTTVADPSAFENDPSQAATDDILKGGTKDDNETSSWKWTSAKPSPPKNDITHAFAAEYTCASTATPPPSNNVPTCDTTPPSVAQPGDKLLYFGGDRFSNSGSANLAFWFFQKRVRQLTADGTPVGPGNTICTDSSGCSFEGLHTAGTVPHSDAQPGDILIISAFGPKAQIQVYEWVGVGNAPKADCVTAACSLVRLIPASAGQACEDVSNDIACGTVNDTGGVDSPWVLSQKGAPANQFDATNFFEGGVNLSRLGLAGACFSSFLMNTRASASPDAELHDKVLGQFARCVPALTTQASTNGTVSPGAAVTDKATVTVTGAATPDDATGTVTFFLCKVVAPATDCSTGGNNVGTGALANQPGGTTTDGISVATSPTVNDSTQTGNRGPLSPGRYCFRAEASLDNYDNPDAATNSTTECFNVKDTTSISTTQKWLPQDSATVATGSGVAAPTGTVTFSLYLNGTCSGTPARTFTDNTVPYETNNLTYETSSTTISWSATFASDDPGFDGSTTTRCERSDLTINNSASAFPPPPGP